jgi:hypothetical protein
MRGYVGPDDGYSVKVLRILSAAVVLVAVTAGCGGAGRPQARQLVPRALARDWESRAAAIATAAASGNGCDALQLAKTLRSDVIAQRHKLPLRLRSPLVAGVNALAGSIRCAPAPPRPTPPKKQPKPPTQGPKPPKHHDHHDHHGDHGDGGDGG